MSKRVVHFVGAATGGNLCRKPAQFGHERTRSAWLVTCAGCKKALARIEAAGRAAVAKMVR